ncbi:TetR/AcrR family transcriptional regulator [Mycolicibacterium frederiksbergense]|uniref:TetR/AcrR family transcriptional regulator n=1 Tax=Mycolicibacterium frederiksbergense TaxID=117567 RepID=UPI00265C3931|nr:TetR/AcrR family transcriptional regulator [Mycolicibacterium frederiksbergense]MBX9920537.1 TetR/AcrR family transcriptional regulator [Mycolicibacterium frederiksbergense]MDO0974481.1 TetR/AcrR family transcriptional regulator [Mycolicibacterium frederiksbergense]
MARTQQQRRADTIARLLDASIATIVEMGYARASAAVIAKRAGLSVGALFRHYPTMGDFMAATGYEVLRRQLESFSKQVAQIPSGEPALPAVLSVLRDITASDTNAVLYELMVAARTDEKLRATLHVVLTEYSAKIFDAAGAVTPTDGLPGDARAVLTAILTNTFDGAAILRPVMADSEFEERKLAMLAEMLGRY